MTWTTGPAPRLPGGLALVLTVALVLPGRADAQAVRGRVLDQTNESPVPVAGVFLLDRDRDVISSALSDAEGWYVLEVPEDGEYILRVQRLGYFETESPLLALSRGGSYDVDLTVRPEPIRIEGLEVEIPFERQNSWAKDRLRFMDPRWGTGNPAEAFGFRLVTGVRLEEAKLRSDDALDLLRWVYVPIYDGLDGMCVQMRPNFNRGTDLRAMSTHDMAPPLPQCGPIYLDGQRLAPEHVAGLDFRAVNAVMVTGGALHLMTVEFEQRFQEARRR